jgi:hypothetical protein
MERYQTATIGKTVNQVHDLRPPNIGGEKLKTVKSSDSEAQNDSFIEIARFHLIVNKFI